MERDDGPTELASGVPGGAVLAAALDAVAVMDHEGIVREWNAAAVRLLGISRDRAIGRELAELIIPAPLRDAHRAGLQHYLETGHARVLDRRLELTAVRADGVELAVELSVTRVPACSPPLFVGFVRSLGDLSGSRRDNARLQQRMAFLARAGLVLDRSLEYDDTLRGLADLLVPDLATLAVIDLLADRGGYELTVAASEPGGLAREVERIRTVSGLDPRSNHPSALVLRAGEPMLLPAMTEEFLSGVSQSREHLTMMRRSGYHSAVVVPLIARGRALGALSLLRMRGEASYGEEDLVLAEELARRAALAVDNARLFESTRRLARTLQQSLLPHALPDIPGVRLTGRYRAAEHGPEVGGDFYDVFSLGSGRWGMTIGDVCGKGAQAAALTAFARYTIRAFAEVDPSRVLHRLNDAVIRERGADEGRLLTALFATVHPEADGVLVDIAAGGHPAPLYLRNTGEREVVDVVGPLIGMDSASTFASRRILLEPGDGLLLYTDGLTDAGAPTRILQEADLVALLRGWPEQDGASLVDALIDGAVAGGDSRDDIAVLLIEHLTGDAGG